MLTHTQHPAAELGRSTTPLILVPQGDKESDS